MPAAESGSMEILELRYVAEGVYEPNLQRGRVSTFRALHLVANSTKRHCVRMGGIPTAEADFSRKHWILLVHNPKRGPDRWTNRQAPRKLRSAEKAKALYRRRSQMRIDMKFDEQVILDWQQRGMNARVLGRSTAENPIAPYLNKSTCRYERDNWLQKADAWLFGWHIENAARG